MEKCPSEAELARFLADEISESRFHSIARHVDVCEQCQRQLDQLVGDEGAGDAGTLATPSQSGEASSPELAALMEQMRASPPLSESGAAGDEDEVHFPGPPTDEAPLGQLADYHIQERIGAGANGILYRAVDSKLGRAVAIKVLRGDLSATSSSRKRFQREARAAASLKNDHLVQVYHVGNEQDFPPYLVMEFVEGKSLSEHLKVHGAMGPREAARIVRESALGLATAHAAGLIHRDVKPSNILLDRWSQRTRLTDFGLVRETSDASLLTAAGTIAGTPAYMSPEQITNPEAVDSRSDVYALGVVLYEALTAELPFRGVLRMTLWQVLHHDPRSPRQFDDAIPRDLETICLKAMAKEPDRRYVGANAMADDLQRFLDGQPILARPIGPVARGWRWCRRNPSVAALATTVTALVLALLIGSWIAAARLAAAGARERQAAQAAAAQRDVALDTLGKLVFELQEDFENDEIDLDNLQKSVLQVALSGLQRVSESAEASGAADYPTAAAYQKMGEILTRLEQDEEADYQLHRAAEILETIVAKTPKDPDVLSLLVQTEWGFADLQSYAGDTAAAIAHAKQAVEYAERLAKGTGTADATSLLSRSLVRLGDHLLEDGQQQKALAQYQLAIVPLREQATASPTDFTLQSELVNLYDSLATACFETEAYSDAERWYRVLLGYLDQLPATEKDWSESYLFWAQYELARVLDAKGESSSARDHHRQAITTLERIAHRSREDPLLVFELLDMYDAIAVTMEESDDLAGAIEATRQQLQVIEQALLAMPEDEDLHYFKAVGLIEFARLKQASDGEATADLQQVADAYAQALVLLRSLETSPRFEDSDRELILEISEKAATIKQQLE